MSELQSPPEKREPPPQADFELPPGNHPLEIAARRGIGPLSPQGTQVWHGFAEPCVSCGQLVKRGANECDQCGQDLSPAMLEKMRIHAGPWYVLEHVRPFPGVSLERIIRQIRRGLITETSILRGPASEYQWRFAVEVPGLCRYFGRCWRCHKEVSPSDAFCQHCLSHLSFEKPQAAPTTPQPGSSPVPGVGPGLGQAPSATPSLPAQREPAAPAAVQSPKPAPPTGAPPASARDDMFSDVASAATPTNELKRLSAAVAELPSHEPLWDEPPRVAGIRATWLTAALLIIVIIVLLLATQTRVPTATSTPPATPAFVQPESPSSPATETPGE